MPGPHQCDDLFSAWQAAVAAHGADSQEAKDAAAAYYAAGCQARSGGAGNHGGDPPQ